MKLVHATTTASLLLCFGNAPTEAFTPSHAQVQMTPRFPATTTTGNPQANNNLATTSTTCLRALDNSNLAESMASVQELAKVFSDGMNGLMEQVNLPQLQILTLASAGIADTTTVAGINDEQTTLQLLQLGASNPWHFFAVAVFGIPNALRYVITVVPDQYDEAPYEPGTKTYSPQAAAEFYQQRPWLVVKRILKMALLTASFNSGLLWDWLVLGKLLGDENYTALKKAEPRRAKQALALCEKLGPTFIKLGQALSIRTDLVPEAYALELRQLQDAVPPFDSTVARKVLEREFQVNNLKQIFSSLSAEPVASASIGQVYRGTLASTGKDVAVKVQRPGILAEIALDLHVLRLLTPIQTALQNAANGVPTTQGDIDLAVDLVDEWGRGFVAETDYRLEAANTMQFQKAMEARGLNAVCAPTVVPELVRDKVLVTEWVEGTRLDRDASPDVPRLCGVAINAYLTMLLDTGVLHCDPHPGNLLRTTDGKLCILDWGMTLAVPNNLQYALLELIAHINVEDYDAIPNDFINLGFSPEGVTAERLKESGITEGLSFAFRQLSQGGGPKKIQERVKAEFQERYGSDLSDEELRNAARAEMLQRMEQQLESEGVDVKGVTNVMEEMSRRNRELFKLPPYVLYVARAFSTLEGIGLSIDENYGIVQECYPYLARRLFTDRSPRAKKALRAMLGLSEEVEDVSTPATVSPGIAAIQAGTLDSLDSSEETSRGGALSPAKLLELSDGFASYTAATADVDRDGAGQTEAVKEFAKLLLDPKGSSLQDILVEETARLSDAGTRKLLQAALVDSAPAQTVASLLQRRKDFVEQNPVLNILLPKPLKTAFVDRPAQIPQLVESVLSLSREDEQILKTATDLVSALGSRLGSSNEENSSASDLSLAAARISSPSAMTSSSVDLEETRTLLANEEARQFLSDQGPGVAALARRLSAGLLRRAAYRTDRSEEFLSEETRHALANLNRRLAERIDVPEDSEAQKDA